MQHPSHIRTLLAGTAGGFIWTVISFLTFGMIGRYTIFNADLQSAKFMHVFTTYDPRPMAVENPLFYLFGFILFAIAHAYLYVWIRPVLGNTNGKRLLRMALLILVMNSLYFEIFGPLNLLHEPLYLVALEMLFWAASIFCEVLVIQKILEKKMEPQLTL